MAQGTERALAVFRFRLNINHFQKFFQSAKRLNPAVLGWCSGHTWCASPSSMERPSSQGESLGAPRVLLSPGLCPSVVRP